MRAVMGGILVAGLFWSLGAAGGGYYLYPPSGRNVVWPPPGGVDRSQPPMPRAEGQDPVPFPYRQAAPRRYLPSYRYRGDFVPPPGPDWPEADYPPPPARQAPRPLEPGRPVEVVPPPGIPVEEVKQQLSRQPQRGWRPVPNAGGLPVVPEEEGKSPAEQPEETQGAAGEEVPQEGPGG